MAPLPELEGNTLGEKHRSYNRLVKEAIANNISLEPGDLNSGENDVAHLMKIDIASHNRDVEYILKVLTCKDMLYVSRAIKKCTWLITEQQYSHIINPTYLNAHLFPEMMVNAKTKFLQHIRLNLKDETRAEQFFNDIVQRNVKNAVKWLPNCSKEFIAPNVRTYLLNSDDSRLFKRLCEKSPDVVQVLQEDEAEFQDDKLQRVNFLLHVNPETYLATVEKQTDGFPRFGARTTKLLLQKFPDRVIDIYKKYEIHLPTFVQYLKKKNGIKDFLFTLFVDNEDRFSETSTKIKLFIDAMTEEKRSQFLDQVFINKVHSDDDLTEGSEKFGMRQFYLAATVIATSPYIYYDFNSAFDKVTKNIQSATTENEKMSFFRILIHCAAPDSNNIQSLLNYYYEKHINDTLKSKKDFLEFFLQIIHVSKLNSESWNILDDLFKRIDIYTAAGNDVLKGLEVIFMCKVIHGEKVPEEIEKQFYNKNYKSFLNENNKKQYNSLNTQDKEKVFKYIYDTITHKIQNQKILNETDFKKGVCDLELILNLLDFSKKELSDYPWILDKIREYLKMKKDRSWKTSMTSIYNKKKQWKKLMFEESIELCPSSSVCLNALKHNKQLLSLEKDEVNALRYKDGVSLQRLLGKLRVYWPQSLGADWTARYLNDLTQQRALKAVVRGLCALLPRQRLLQIIHNYAPKQEKIDYQEMDANILDVQRHLAKNMHIARPQPSPDAILLYAKGDYLQYALPAMLAIFNNANPIQTRIFITKLLSGPVSIQKHGLRIVFRKFKPEETILILRDIWMNTTNSSIRAEVFKLTFSLLNKDENLAKDLWDLLFFFIDNLTHKEDKTIYEILARTKNLGKMSENLRGEYVMKVYKFLKGLIPKLRAEEKNIYKQSMLKLLLNTVYFMECVSTEFMTKILSEFIEVSFMENAVRMLNVMSVLSAFVLCTKADETQEHRYNLVLAPLLQRCILSWDKMEDGKYFLRQNVDVLLNTLRLGLKKYVFAQQMDIPLIIFEDIQKILNQLPMSDNYVMLLKWKLTVEMTRLLNTNRFEESWPVTCEKLAPELGNKCLQYLKSDVASYFPCIYTFFSKALLSMFKDFLPVTAQLIVYQTLLQDVQFVQAYLAVMLLYPDYLNCDDLRREAEKIRKLLSEHPSIEMKMHYNHRFGVKT